jgi:hypothetical protein
MWNCAAAAPLRAGRPRSARRVLEWQRCPPAFCETGWYASPAVLDVDRDGIVDVLCGGYTLLAVRGDTGAIQWSHTPAGGAGRIWPGVAVADLDGDGVKEILHASYDGRVHAFWASDRTEHGFWPFDVNLGETTLRFASEPVVADLDGDGSAEVVFTTWTAKGSDQGGDLFVVSAAGSELARVALPRSTQNWDGALGAPTIANLDADPEMEVVVGTAHTGLVAYEIPGSRAGRMPWPTGRGNVARTAPEPGAGSAAIAAGASIALLARTRRLRV